MLYVFDCFFSVLLASNPIKTCFLQNISVDKVVEMVQADKEHEENTFGIKWTKHTKEMPLLITYLNVFNLILFLFVKDNSIVPDSQPVRKGSSLWVYFYWHFGYSFSNRITIRSLWKRLCLMFVNPLLITIQFTRSLELELQQKENFCIWITAGSAKRLL